MANDGCWVPDWRLPPTVRALQTTRLGGCSPAPYASLNLGDHVGDAPLNVVRNRQRLALPCEPCWLKQVHGVAVVEAEGAAGLPEADASLTRRAGVVCAVMTADCLPVLLCDRQGTVVAAAHAGWRGLCDGILERTVVAMRVPPDELQVWLGPAIGPSAFEVGAEVRAAFVARQAEAAAAFIQTAPDKFHADLWQLARLRLQAQGVTDIGGGGVCTFSDAQHYFSYRRDGVTGRMASLIWLQA